MIDRSPDRSPDPTPASDDDVRDQVEQLRTALRANGITLPSLDVDPVSFAHAYATPSLVALGNCNLATARELTTALRRAAER
jgi:hypothetical protein